MILAHMKDTHSSFILPDQTCQRFTLSDIQSATNNFDETLVVVHGGFGKVYKCSNKILSLTQVALKRLNSMSNQGASEFEAEVKVLSKLRYANPMSLIGYCHEGNEMVLAYEFMPNGTLQEHLRKVDSGLSWLQRLNVCIGAARGLDYLHSGSSTQDGVIHRDMKTSNILLDASFEAKISDFGLAKIIPINQTQTYVSTLVKGTFGYMDPCYFNSGKLTKKSDVYAFGVVLFEVLTGKRAADSTLDEEQWSLAVWAQNQIKEGKLNHIVDYSLKGHISKKCLKEFANIAIHCLDNQPKQRPTMAEVVIKLESILSQERERDNSGVGEGRFINKVRYFLTGKADSIPDPALRSKTEIKGSLRPFTYAELVSATYNFSYEEFSPTLLETIYKGWVDEGTYAPTQPGFGLAIYVRKRNTPGTSELHFKSEDFNHPNLVKLLGYCLNEHELCYVYELTPRSSLDKLLFGDRGTTSFSWVARLKIALGTAHGLSFLHQREHPAYSQFKTTCILVDTVDIGGHDRGTTSFSWVTRLKIALGTAHGLSFLHQREHPAYSQFKTTCILVDTDYTARLSNFVVENSSVDIDSYSFRMDAHYAAPEWFRYQADVILEGFGVRSDIYSFGVVLLEILTGMKVFDENRQKGKQNLVKWATPLLANEVNLGIIMDPQLKDYNHRPPKGAFNLALLVSKCLQPLHEERPSMEEIIKVLYQCYLEEIKV